MRAWSTQLDYLTRHVMSKIASPLSRSTLFMCRLIIRPLDVSRKVLWCVDNGTLFSANNVQFVSLPSEEWG